MLRPRIIPCLLLKDKELVKTVQFKEPKYIGDPINAVRIFNEKQVDELMVLDIDATVQKQEPDYALIAQLAEECRMPLCYGGGITTVEQAQHILSLGVEKIAISAAAIQNPELITTIAQRVGSQSVAVVLDIKKSFLGNYEIFTHNGSINTKRNLTEFVQVLQTAGVGEIIINAIDRDGTLKGYDQKLNDKVFAATHIPVTFMGGAASFADFESMMQRYGAIGIAAGSVFVLKGKYRAVLIQYPNPTDKARLLGL